MNQCGRTIPFSSAHTSWPQLIGPKEDMWLNSMAAEGWTLCQIGWCTYWFERTDPGAYEVRLECRKPDEAYISFVKDTGAEYIGHMMQWLYFRRKSELGHFELNSDLDSRIEQLNNMGRILLPIGILNLGIGLMNLRYNGLGGINLICAGLLAYAYGRIQGKRDELQRERQLHE